MKDCLLPDIQKIPNFFSRIESAHVLKTLFDLQELWDKREERTVQYRKPDWYTFGSSLYLDLKEDFYPYAQKAAYFNEVMWHHFSWLLNAIKQRLPNTVFLIDEIPSASVPSFHIFKGHPTFTEYFGSIHLDVQWKQLEGLIGFSDRFPEITNHKSYTLLLKSPYLGASLKYGCIDPECMCENTLNYEENAMYVHSGQFKHMIDKFKWPLLPGDYRISIQFHSFDSGGLTYLYR